jgi:CheY-like chemotaxis protein
MKANIKKTENSVLQVDNHILIVDDELNIQKLLYSYLSPDYNIIIKSSSVDALRWIQNGNQPLLIISEYQLPYLSGASFISIIKASGLYCKIPVIMLSASDEFEQKLSNLPFAIEGIIRKPFNPIHLKTTIQNCIHE